MDRWTILWTGLTERHDIGWYYGQYGRIGVWIGSGYGGLVVIVTD